jgi:hypothetical protein
MRCYLDTRTYSYTADFTFQFTCFTGTKVQILTLQEERMRCYLDTRTYSYIADFTIQFTCFTGTKSTNTDAAGGAYAVLPRHTHI